MTTQNLFILFFYARVSIRKGEKLRDILRRNNLLEKLLQEHHYDIATKYTKHFPVVFSPDQLADEPLLNYLDVSCWFSFDLPIEENI